MQRTTRTYSIKSISNLNEKLLQWAQQYETAVWLDSNNHHQGYTSFHSILAVDEFTSIQTDVVNAFEKLKEYQSITQDYLFGYLSYDVKNATENLTSTNSDGLGFAELFFFQPQKILFIKNDSIEFQYLTMVDDEIDTDFEAICTQEIKQKNTTSTRLENGGNIVIKPRIQKQDYLFKVGEILEHIHKGDIYEANFCQEFYAENTRINPLDIYEDLNTISEAPFATFLKIDNQYLLCASPERYLKKEGAKIISQPIKGTAKRLVDLQEDQNESSHHTDKYESIVFRRGQEINLNIILTPGFDKSYYDLSMQINGPDGQDMVSVPGVQFDANQWYINVGEPQPKSSLPFFAFDDYVIVPVTVFVPFDIPVGEYDISARLQRANGVGTPELLAAEDKVFFIFNPWSDKDDDVYNSALSDNDRASYVLKTQGNIYQMGSPKRWDYAQFDDSVFQATIKLIEKLPVSDRSVAWRVTRHISAIANSNDNGGVIVGFWPTEDDGLFPYFPFSTPNSWTGSGEIFDDYNGGFFNSSGSVKYG